MLWAEAMKKAGATVREAVTGPSTNIFATDDQGQCNLIANPNTSEQLSPKV